MNTSNFNWALIPSFLAALEHGSLMGAARATGMSQPTLGRHIAELEDQLKVILFERTGRGLQPTAQALELAEAANTMRDGAAQFSRMASGSGQTVRGRVRLSASQPVACFLLPPILARMRQALPDVVVELVVSNSVSNLLLREADLALRMVRPEQGSLVAKHIGQMALRACASQSYLQRKGTPLLPTDLLAHDLITGDRNTEIEDGFAALGFPANSLLHGLRTDDLIAHWAAVQAGLGVGFVSEHLIDSDPTVEAILPMIELPVLPIWLTVHRELRTSALMRAVFDFLADEVPLALAGPAKP
ncbi:LysR family transcriptional regulator [Limnohabitans sp. Rim8]|jgi:DNA-binding transcriptional LysR family regulator|uniref:LysR family transcriptional regulator n=1 Tax=Limnohabitans sp. Rim8 TaxID=1100718 RepID=UPI0025FCF75D|nr:LysR family transcriptional regulator [Limnohabitans sp. Rim8]